MQAELRIDALPESSLDAAAQFHAQHLSEAQALLEGEADALAVVLPPAPTDHDDWRRAIARDLARKYAPKRVNVLSNSNPESVCAMLTYLRAAPGITGQYLPLHD